MTSLESHSCFSVQIALAAVDAGHLLGFCVGTWKEDPGCGGVLFASQSSLARIQLGAVVSVEMEGMLLMSTGGRVFWISSGSWILLAEEIALRLLVARTALKPPLMCGKQMIVFAGRVAASSIIVWAYNL